MTREETVLLCRYVRACCPQQAIDQYTPDAWYDLLGDLRLDDCRQAVKAVAQRQPFVAPAEIRAEVRRIREERIGPAGPGLGPVPPPADPDDPKGYLAAMRAQQRAVGDGRLPRALPTGEDDGADSNDNPHVEAIRARFEAEQAAARRREAEEREAEREALAAYRAAIEHLLGLPDHGTAAMRKARDELLGDQQAAQGFPRLSLAAGVTDEHKIAIFAAEISGRLR